MQGTMMHRWELVKFSGVSAGCPVIGIKVGNMGYTTLYKNSSQAQYQIGKHAEARVILSLAKEPVVSESPQCRSLQDSALGTEGVLHRRLPPPISHCLAHF